MSDLEVRLVELGGQIDHPAGEDLIDRVRAEIGTDALDAAPPVMTPGQSRPRARRRMLAVAAALVVATVALPGTRSAIADFFRVDGVDLRSDNALRQRPARGPTTTSTTAPPAGSLEAARQQAEFALRVPAAPAPSSVSVDPTVPGAMVSLDYPEFRIVEFAAPADGAVMAKFVGAETKVAPTEVRGRPGYWITGTHHQIASLDRNNEVRTDTLRSVGHVLLWSEDGVTIRIEGPETLATALAIADTLG